MIILPLIDTRKITEYLPAQPPRQNVLEAIEILGKHMETNSLNVSTIVAPTGFGKTEVLVALATYFAVEEGKRVVYFARGKLARDDLTIRFAEVLTRIKEKGLEPPRTLIVYSKFDTCPNRIVVDMAIKKAYEMAEEGETEEDIIARAIALFYMYCEAYRTSHQCPFHSEKIPDIVIDELVDKYIMLTRIPVRKIPRQYKTIHGYGTIANIPGIANIANVALKASICPFLLIKEIIKRDMARIIVMDQWYLLVQKRMGAPRPDDIVIVDEAHELPFAVRRIPVSTMIRLLRKYGLREEATVVTDALRQVATRLEDTDTYVKFGVAVDEAPPEIIIPETTVKMLVEKAKEKQDYDDLAKLAIYRGILSLKPYGRMFVALRARKTGGSILYYAGGILPPRLDTDMYERVIFSSATITKLDVAILTDLSIREAGETMIRIPADYKRKTIVIPIDTGYNSRPDVLQHPLVKKILNEKRPLLLVMNMSWRDHVSYLKPYVLEPTPLLDERERRVAEARKVLESGGVVLISPHTSYAVSIDIINAEKDFKGVALGVENTPYPDLKREILKKSLKKLPGSTGTLFIDIKLGVARTLQALGRIQRSPRHELEVYLIGKHMPPLLDMLSYKEVYGGVEYAGNQNK